MVTIFNRDTGIFQKNVEAYCRIELNAIIVMLDNAS